MKLACITPIERIDGLSILLNSFADISYSTDASKCEVIKLIIDNGCTGIYTNPNMQGFVIDRDILDLGIKVVCTASTGLNHIDVDYCKKNKIHIISLTSDYDTINNISATAEHAFALTMSLIRNISKSFDSVKDGKWEWSPFVGRQLMDLKFGVVGFGRLGKMYAKYASAFSSYKISVCDPYKDIPFYYRSCELTELFSYCDVVSLHVHLNDETSGIINRELFNHPCYLINTSRGGIVNESDIILGLKSGEILGYATDVLSDELNSCDNSPLISEINKEDQSDALLNILITPHIAGMTIESRKCAYSRVANVLKKWIENK